MAQALTVILIEHGYDASFASSAEGALISCRRKRPDVVIIGTLLGPTEAAQLAIQIVTGHRDCKVLRVSDDGRSLTHPKTPSSMDDDFSFFPKPVDSQGILDFLQTFKPKHANAPC
jgi:DNA-binding NtrC family response regulator